MKEKISNAINTAFEWMSNNGTWLYPTLIAVEYFVFGYGCGKQRGLNRGRKEGRLMGLGEQIDKQ